MDHGFLRDMLILLTAAIVVVPLLHHVKIPPVLGYLAAGLAIGPFAFGLVEDVHGIQVVAEFGVVFLLFSVGLELPIQRLKAMRKLVFGLGLAQVAVSAALIGGLAVGLGLPPDAAFAVGCALAMSSTAVVIRMLVERHETVSRTGRMAIAILLFQDLAVVPILVLMPLLKGGDPAAIPMLLATALAKGVGAVLFILVVGRMAVKFAYKYIAATGSPEVFTAANIALVLGVGWLTAEAGMSMALGAFVAGLLLADTAYRHQVEADIEPFRGLLLGLFFMTIGMSIDLPVIGRNAPLVFGLTFGMLAVKTFAITALCRSAGVPLSTSVRTGLLLSQGGEFAFIVFAKAVGLGMLDADTANALVAAAALSMAVTPLLGVVGRAVEQRLDERGAADGVGAEHHAHGHGHGHGHEDVQVIVAGYGRVGQAVSRVLADHHIPYMALDLNPKRVAAARAFKQPVFFGDARQPGVLRAAGTTQATVAVVAFDQPEPTLQAVEMMRKSHPDLCIVARAQDTSQRKALEAAGANFVVPEAMETSLKLARLTLRAKGVDAQEAAASIERYRADNYAKLDGFAMETTTHPRTPLDPEDRDTPPGDEEPETAGVRAAE